jgi:hypothetical protein
MPDIGGADDRLRRGPRNDKRRSRKKDRNLDCHPGASNGILARLPPCWRSRPRAIREAMEAYTRIFML